jgi:adenylate cyclase, class 2
LNPDSELEILPTIMSSVIEVEVKFRIEDLERLTERLRTAGFRLITPRTHEINTLFDFPDRSLRKQGLLLRLREYGERWTVTFKGKAAPGRYKSRTEVETTVQDGEAMTVIFESVGFSRVFSYEKFRTEWSDGQGHVVLDETPIGNFGEIEGSGEWIESAARKLQISPEQYITDSYATLFQKWKDANGSKAMNMCFAEIKADST